MNSLIYTVTAVPERGHCRCVGYFYSYQDALNAINKYGINGLDEAGLFKYLVVEKFEAGIYAISFGAEAWFIADHNTNSWVELQDKPEQFKGTINYGMG